MPGLKKLTLLLPSWPRGAGHEFAPTLLRWLARGDRLAGAPARREAVLRECFEFIGTLLPTAALTRSLDADDAPNVLWLRADPAYLMADAVTLRLLACGNLELSADEINGFAQALRPLFGDAGFPLEATRPDRWYLHCAREAKLPTFSAPAAALGDDLALHLPEGENAQRWRRLLNEVQIVLTQHPLNAQRTRRGLPPVNSLWIWGAGVLPEWVRSDFTQVFSNDEIAHALAKLAKIPVSSVPPDALKPVPSPTAGETALDDKGSSLLIDLADQRNIAALERNWFTPHDTALRARKIDTLHLRFESGERYAIKPAHRWRFWRRAKPLT